MHNCPMKREGLLHSSCISTNTNQGRRQSLDHVHGLFLRGGGQNTVERAKSTINASFRNETKRKDLVSRTTSLENEAFAAAKLRHQKRVTHIGVGVPAGLRARRQPNLPPQGQGFLPPRAGRGRPTLQTHTRGTLMWTTPTTLRRACRPVAQHLDSCILFIYIFSSKERAIQRIHSN